MIHAAGMGVVLSLIGAEEEDRDPGLSEMTREAILAAVTTDASPEAAAGQAGPDRVSRYGVALKAVLPEAPDTFTPSESALLAEWLDRLIRDPR